MLFNTQELRRAIEDIYRYPLRQGATDTLNRQLRSGISDQALAELVIALRDEDRLCIVQEGKTDARTTDYLFIGGLPQVALNPRSQHRGAEENTDAN